MKVIKTKINQAQTKCDEIKKGLESNHLKTIEELNTKHKQELIDVEENIVNNLLSKIL